MHTLNMFLFWYIIYYILIYDTVDYIIKYIKLRTCTFNLLYPYDIDYWIDYQKLFNIFKLYN